MSLKRVIKEDEDYRTYRRIMRLSQNLDIQTLLDEAARLHAQKYSRMLMHKSNPSAKSLTKASTENAAYRSRLVEIHVILAKAENQISEAQSAIKGKLLSHYGDDIPSRTKHERAMWLEAGPLKFGIKRLSKLKIAKFEIEQYIQDIDKQSFDLTRMSNLLELRTKREHVV